MDRQIIAEEVLAAVGGKENVTANDICMTRLRILTRDPSLVDTEKLSAARGVLGYVKRGAKGIEVVFGPGKVEPVHEALVKLTGIAPKEDLFENEREIPHSSPLKVQISSNPLLDAALSQLEIDRSQAAEDEAEEEPGEDFELASLLKAIDTVEKEPDDGEVPAPAATDAPRLLVLNGPNINMLGIREPGIYGHDSYQRLLALCQEAASEAGFADCTCYQSNHEGDLVDAIQDAYQNYDGIVINPGAYTHTSIAILDAAKAVGLPMVEVHISKVDEREDFRQVSYIRAACFETIAGMGIEGYRKAILDLAKKIRG